MNNQISEYVENSSPEFKKIMVTIRQLIHENIPNVIEEFKWNRPIFKTEKDFAYLKVNKNDVTLGFTHNINALVDPQNLLQGTGKTMRHIKIKKHSDIDSNQLIEWLKFSSTFL